MWRVDRPGRRTNSLARDRYVELDRWLAWVAADGDVRGEAVVAEADSSVTPLVLGMAAWLSCGYWSLSLALVVNVGRPGTSWARPAAR